MPDITMCYGSKCPKKQDCYRYTAKPSPYLQSYFPDIPYDNKKQKCYSFVDNRPREKNNETKD